MTWRTVPPAAGSSFPVEDLQRQVPRTAFDWTRSLIAAARKSSSAIRVISVLPSSSVDLLPLKSYRVAISAPNLVEGVHQLLLVKVAHHVERESAIALMLAARHEGADRPLDGRPGRTHGRDDVPVQGQVDMPRVANPEADPLVGAQRDPGAGSWSGRHPVRGTPSSSSSRYVAPSGSPASQTGPPRTRPSRGGRSRPARRRWGPEPGRRPPTR